MKKGLTELVFIIDGSGSMLDLTADTIGGFNAMIGKQKDGEGEALVSTVIFNNEFKVVHDRMDLKEIEKMTEKDYVAYGSTALIDAIGRSVKHISTIHRYIREEDLPEKTVFVITTDGMENASRQYSSDEVKRMIRAKEEAGWEFLFLGANIDSVETARSLGIRENRAANYRATRAGEKAKYSVMSDVVLGMRAGKHINEDWAAPLDAEEK